MRALKILGIAVGGLVALGLLLVLAVWLLVDPNDYRDRIAAAVKSSTGRELTLTGDIKLSVFPWIALEAGPASLGNPAGFGPEPFATLERVKLRVRLLPLLRKQIQAGRVEIDGLDLRLAQNAEGKGNWEDFGETTAEPEAGSPSAPPLDVAGIRIANSRISFDTLVAQNVDIEVGRVAPGQTTPFEARLDLTTGPGASPLPLRAAFDLTMDAAGDRYRLADVSLEGSMVPGEGAAAVPWKFSAPTVDLDIGAQTLAAPQFAAAYAIAQLSGALEGTQIIDAPQLRGSFALQSLSPRELMRQLGIEAPVTRDGNVLSALSLTGGYVYADDQVRAENLQMKLDESAMTGRLGMNLESGAVEFDLALDRIDLDRYLPPPTADAADAGDSEPFEVPVDALKDLTARGQLSIGAARVVDVALSDLKLGFDANQGVARIAPARAGLYGGQYAGEISIDTRPAAPRVSMDHSMTGIDVAALLDDFADTRRLSGKGNVTMKLAASGRNSDLLTKTLTGRVNANLANGAVEGVDLWYAISQAQSLLQKRTLAGGTNAGRTAFDTFRMSADVVDGVATTSDLNIASQLLRVTGKGSTNLVTETLDYQVTATILKAPPGAAADIAGLTLAAIPVNVTGTLDEPKVRPDLEGIAKARLKQEVDKRKDELKEKVQEKLQDRLKNLLR
jgi:AsmA protein